MGCIRGRWGPKRKDGIRCEQSNCYHVIMSLEKLVGLVLIPPESCQPWVDTRGVEAGNKASHEDKVSYGTTLERPQHVHTSPTHSCLVRHTYTCRFSDPQMTRSPEDPQLALICMLLFLKPPYLKVMLKSSSEISRHLESFVVTNISAPLFTKTMPVTLRPLRRRPRRFRQSI